MRPEIMETIESRPNDYPDVIGIPEWVWQRIEAYCSHRWTPRTVTWVVSGSGLFRPPLTPAVITKVEEWDGGVWTERLVADEVRDVSLTRITATVGTYDDPPADVIQAATLLTEYTAESATRKGHRSLTTGDITVSFNRDRRAMAQALQLSGAADLLRPYRRPR
ncbi:hypothetical protein GIY56_06520 [Paracoccus sp. YIM 132242]|uniref:Uncharacterized protein n=1 Tax=Paracoccus lichenicola TaxID=2665644 RepID=A0A6L6HL86_9RHOB|nr:hypothetical protein [Paracoccus lichenicola]MTD99933.1 hypothetical protein [Paracoccus lichenicola]